jgi:GTP1/Obg family GTP-binding protein
MKPFVMTLRPSDRLNWKKMARLTFTFIFTLTLIATGFTQTTKEEEPESFNQEWKMAMEEVSRTLREVEIPQVDVDQIMDEVRKSMPTREELDSYKAEIADAVREIQKIDLSEMERMLDELAKELDQLFSDHFPNREKTNKEDNIRKIE